MVHIVGKEKFRHVRLLSRAQSFERYFGTESQDRPLYFQSILLLARQLSPIFLRVVKRTLKAFKTRLALSTRLRFVHQRVELLLLPPVGVVASLDQLAAFLIRCDERAGLPSLAQADLVGEQGRPAPEILIVVSVETLGLVVLVVERTPLCLEILDVEVECLRGRCLALRRYQSVHQANFDVFH